MLLQVLPPMDEWQTHILKSNTYWDRNSHDLAVIQTNTVENVQGSLWLIKSTLSFIPLCISGLFDLCCKPCGAPTTDDTNQPSSLRPHTICWPIVIVSKLYAHSDSARLRAKPHKTADVEQATNRCASCNHIGVRGS